MKRYIFTLADVLSFYGVVVDETALFRDRYESLSAFADHINAMLFDFIKMTCRSLKVPENVRPVLSHVYLHNTGDCTLCFVLEF